MVRIGFQSVIRSSNSTPHQDQMTYHKPYICPQRSKKSSHHTSNSDAKLTLQTSFSSSIISSAMRPHSLHCRPTVTHPHLSPSRCSAFWPFLTAATAHLPLPVLPVPFWAYSTSVPRLPPICLFLSKGMGQEGSNNHWSPHKGERGSKVGTGWRGWNSSSHWQKSCLATVESTEGNRKEADGLGTWKKNSGASRRFQKENLKKQLELFAPCSFTKNSNFKY